MIAVPGLRLRRRTAIDLARYAVAALYLVFVVAPVVYMVLIAFHTTASAGTGTIIPPAWHWQTFTEMWQRVNLATYMRNSIVVAAVTGALASVLSLGAGYVVARFRFRFRHLFRLSLIASHLIPGVLLLPPLFVMYVIVQQLLQVLIIGSYLGVVLTYMTFALPCAIWIISVYITSLPVELEEAAMIDGASRFGVLRWITLPLSIPGLVVTFVFSFLLAWNDVLFASVLTSPRTRTLGAGLQYFLSESSAFPQWNELMGASIVSAVPAVILFLLVQRYVVTGLTGGSLKG